MTYTLYCFSDMAAPLAEKFDTLERLGEFHASLLPKLGVVGSCPRLTLGPRTLHLAGVAVERIHLDGKGVSDIEEGVRLLGAPEIDFPDLVGFQPFLQMLRIRQRIAGVGKNRIQGHTTTHGVVAVPDVAAVGVYRDHGLRLMETNLPNQFFTKFGAILQALVWEAQEHYLGDAQNLSRLALLLSTEPGEVFRLNVSITRAFISIRTDY